MAKAVKLADIAVRLGVSTVTVSKALSGQKGVSDEMREKIRQLAEEMGYQPPSTQKKEKRSYNLGVVIAERYLDKYDSFYWQMYQQLATKAVTKECFTMTETITAEVENGCELPKLLQEQKVDGLVVIGKIADGYLEFLSDNAEVPLIFLDFCNNKQNMDAVISDSYYGAYCLTNYLFDMGHKKIAYVGTILSTGSITDRYLGYVKSLLEHGESPKAEWQIDDRRKDDCFIDAENLLKLPTEDMPTAFFCNCDLTASILIKKLGENGYRVPEDISVVGYDNYLFPGLCDVGITTYEVDMKEMARRTIHTILKKIRGESYRKGIHIVEGHLVIKESVKRIKG
ncbi:MAG: LacI family DNA-binding transcriptional regulator [Lachnospiraceae bacterium]|nr:LacI family DNA-binding transcriptional regulator [Lachnospiraceae bacterium]